MLRTSFKHITSIFKFNSRNIKTELLVEKCEISGLSTGSYIIPPKGPKNVIKKYKNIETNNEIYKNSDEDPAVLPYNIKYLKINMKILKILIAIYLLDVLSDIYLARSYAWESKKMYRYWIISIYLFWVSSAIITYKGQRRRIRQWSLRHYIFLIPIWLFNLEPVYHYLETHENLVTFKRELHELKYNEDLEANKNLWDEYEKILHDNKEIATMLLAQGLLQACPQVILQFSILFYHLEDYHLDKIHALQVFTMSCSIVSFTVTICYWQTSLFYLWGKTLNYYGHVAMFTSVFLILVGRLFSIALFTITFPLYSLYAFIIHVLLYYIFTSLATEKYPDLFSSILNVILPPVDEFSRMLIFAMIFILENLTFVAATILQIKWDEEQELLKFSMNFSYIITFAGLLGLVFHVSIKKFNYYLISTTNIGTSIYKRKIKDVSSEDLDNKKEAT